LIFLIIKSAEASRTVIFSGDIEYAKSFINQIKEKYREWAAKKIEKEKT